MANSVSKGFGTAMKKGSSRRFKRHPTNYIWVSSWLPFTVDEGLSWFILILSKGKLTWHSPIGCWVSFESSCLACFHGSAKIHAHWAWYSSQIGELWTPPECAYPKPMSKSTSLTEDFLNQYLTLGSMVWSSVPIWSATLLSVLASRHPHRFRLIHLTQ